MKEKIFFHLVVFNPHSAFALGYPPTTGSYTFRNNYLEPTR